jgi:aspartate aminotransferase
MTLPVSEAVGRLAGSQRTSQLVGAAALRERGIVPLNTGDPNFDTPGYIVEAAYQAMKQGFTHYPPAQGDLELRTAIAEMLNEDHGQSFAPADILITNGGSGAIYSAVAGLLNPGDQAILFNPCYSLYDDALKVVGAETVWVPFRPDDFHLDPEALERAITPRTKAIILNSPCNPTSVVLSRGELEAIQEIVLRHDLVLISDEIYDHLVFDGRTFVSALDLPELAERTLLVNGFSKTYAMTGWRLGYLAGKNGLVESAVAIGRTMHGPVSYPTQRAGLAALSGLNQPWLPEMQAAYDRRRRLGHERLSSFSRLRCALPEAAFYFWVQVDTSMSSRDMVAYFLDAGVAVRSGSEFGTAGEGYLRLTFAASDEDIIEGVERLGRAAERLPR